MTTSSAMPYAFFLDTISSYTNTPNGSVIIGETNLAGQKEINDSKRFFGMSAAFNGGGDATATWRLIKQKINTISRLSGNAKASAIVNAALLYPIELDPSLNGGRPEDPKNWFYAQNFQMKNPADAAENYAFVTIMLWAANQLYPNTKIIPVFDSYYVKGLNFPSSGIVDEVNALITPLGIPALEKINDKPPEGKQWNMLSTFYNNNLIDGWIGDIYGDKGDTTNLEGKLPTPESPFYSKNPVPYVLQSRSDYLDQKSKLPIGSDYYDPKGIMPFNASIDFNGDLTVPVGYSPSSKLTPVPKPYPATSLAPIGVQTTDGYTKFTGSDESLIGQSDIKSRMRGGDDYLEVIGGNNYAHGNMGKDIIVLRGGIGEYLGGKGNDTFIVIETEAGTLIRANRGADIITGFASGVIYRSGKGDDVISVSQGKVWGNRGKDVFRGVAGEGYAQIQDYTIGEDIVEIAMDGVWSNIDSGLMFTDTSGDKLMLLMGINDVEQVTVV